MLSKKGPIQSRGEISKVKEDKAWGGTPPGIGIGTAVYSDVA